MSVGGDPTTASEVGSDGGVRGIAMEWLLLSGHRIAVAAGIDLVLLLTILALIWLDVVAIGPSGRAATLFASGLASGTLTLVTVALSINQLILSRVFGSPAELSEKLTGTRELRTRVQRLADEPSTPIDPAAFLSLVARTMSERATRLRDALRESDWEPPETVAEYVDGIDRYCANIDSSVEPETDIVDILEIVVGTEYAENPRATEHVRNEYRDRLSGEAVAELDAIDDLLESVAIARQFFKTLSLQQDFALLSRVIAYTGLLALLASLVLALIYLPDGLTVPAGVLPFVFAGGVTTVLTPLSVFTAYILRAATIAHRTVSVGPFVPPQERS